MNIIIYLNLRSKIRKLDLSGVCASLLAMWHLHIRGTSWILKQTVIVVFNLPILLTENDHHTSEGEDGQNSQHHHHIEHLRFNEVATV